MLTVKCQFEDGDYLITRINATWEEAKNYYLNNYFNVGLGPEDNMQKCVKVEEYPIQDYFRAYMIAHNIPEEDINKVKNYDYMTWINSKHSQFKELNNMNRWQPYTDKKREEFKKWLFEQVTSR